MARNKGQCPIRHVIIEETKEVYFVGSFTTGMGLKAIVAKYFPGYTGKLATEEYFNKLKLQHESD